jgi:transposase
MKFKALQMKRHFIVQKTVIGIDPAKQKHQAAVIDENGLQVGDPFTFKASYRGYSKELWDKLSKISITIDPSNTVFAIECSCNLWQTLAFYLNKIGYQVLLVSPLTTRHSRPFLNHDFSKTDPKDALLVANNARDGYFDYFQDFSQPIQAIHHLSITYDKLRKDLVKNKQRLRSQIEQVFPEFLTVMKSDIDTARWLLKHYFLPHHYLKMDIEKVVPEIERTSHDQYGRATLQQLKELAQHSIGIPVEDVYEISIRITIQSWILSIELLQQQMDQLMSQMIYLTQQMPYFKILTSLKGISDKTAAFFIAETRDLSQFDHYKKLEKFAGLNLKQSQSGQYVGRRRISHIGNHRLRWVLYKMTEETARYVPEVRMKFLRRQIKQRIYRKNVVASSTTLLKLIVAMVKKNKVYEPNKENIKAVEILEIKYDEIKSAKRRKKAS